MKWILIPSHYQILTKNNLPGDIFGQTPEKTELQLSLRVPGGELDGDITIGAHL